MKLKIRTIQYKNKNIKNLKGIGRLASKNKSQSRGLKKKNNLTLVLDPIN